MTNFETQYFQKMKFGQKQIDRYFASARRDLNIAKGSDFPEAKFKFAYDALIKLGIALIARQGFKVRSQPGHHVKIIEKMSELLRDENVAVIGNKMRQDRNKDFYEGGIFVSEKESGEYVEFVEKVYSKSLGMVKI